MNEDLKLVKFEFLITKTNIGYQHQIKKQKKKNGVEKST